MIQKQTPLRVCLESKEALNLNLGNTTFFMIFKFPIQEPCSDHLFWSFKLYWVDYSFMFLYTSNLPEIWFCFDFDFARVIPQVNSPKRKAEDNFLILYRTKEFFFLIYI